MPKKTASIATNVQVCVTLHLQVEAAPNGNGFVVTRVHQMTIPTPEEVMAAISDDIWAVQHEFLRQCAEALDVEPPDGFGTEASGETAPASVSRLDVIRIARPVWANNWRDLGGQRYRRYLIVPDDDGYPSPRSVSVGPSRPSGASFFFEGGTLGDAELYADGYSSPEGAFEACEKAIMAAWAKGKG